MKISMKNQQEWAGKDESNDKRLQNAETSVVI